MGEKYADGLAEREELLVAINAIPQSGPSTCHPSFAAYATANPDYSGRVAAIHASAGTSVMARRPLGMERRPKAVRQAVTSAIKAEKESLRAIAVLYRDILGNPFRAVSVDSTSTALRALAEQAYNERLPDGTLNTTLLCALADALEQAACRDAELLGHLRNPGPRYRGCWALDLVIDKG